MPSGKKWKRPSVRIVVVLLAALFAIVAGYTALDMRKGSTMAVDACSSAIPGWLLAELLPTFPGTGRPGDQRPGP